MHRLPGAKFLVTRDIVNHRRCPVPAFKWPANDGPGKLRNGRSVDYPIFGRLPFHTFRIDIFKWCQQPHMSSILEPFSLDGADELPGGLSAGGTGNPEK